MIVIGGDTETYNGEPITFQFYSEDYPINEIIWTNGKNSIKDFLAFCNKLPRKRVYAIYCHNLAFDIISFFYARYKDLASERACFEIKYGKWTISGIFSSTTFAVISHETKSITIHLIDTSAFFYGSLDKLSETFCPTLRKLNKPKGLGSKRFKPSNRGFVKYAMRDAVICYHIGSHIQKFHDDFDIRQSVSIAQMSARIFRHKFMKYDIPLPPLKVVHASMHSYHGGKNNITVPLGLYKNVYLIDIVSQYPYAMSQFPSFSDLNLYKAYKCNGHPDKVPPYGVYRIDGTIKDCPYPIIHNHAFQKITGHIKRLWITGFELNEAIRMKEIKVDRIYGYFYKYELDKKPSPFKAFVKDFYIKKETAKNKINRTFFKIVLNSLYGKFIQTNRNHSISGYDLENESMIEEMIREAGGLFHPFIASMITGHARVQLHQLEHKYKSIHSATDSVMSFIKPKVKKNPTLGDINLEHYGDALILRCKLYILYDKKGKIAKYALHGFRGKVEDLERMYRKGDWSYEYTKPNKLKESIRRGLKVNHFETRKATLKLKLH